MAEKPSSPVSNLNELVTCPICLENFKDARALPCLHSYCKACLQGLVTPQGRITCPHCRMEVDVPNGDVSNLKANFIVNDVVDVLNATSDISVVSDNRVANCKEHPEKQYELFCQDCFKLICFKCVSNWGTCGLHKYESIETVAVNYRRDLEGFLQQKVEQLPSFMKHANALDQLRKKQLVRVSEVTKQISDTFAMHIDCMKHREDELIEQALQAHEKHKNGLSCEIDRVELEQAKIHTTIDFCQEMLEINDPTLFLQNYAQMKDKMHIPEGLELISHIKMNALSFHATNSLLTDVILTFGNVIADEEGNTTDEKPARADRLPLNKPNNGPLLEASHSDKKIFPNNAPLPNEPFPGNDQFRHNDFVPVHVPVPVNKPRANAAASPVPKKLYITSGCNQDVISEDKGLSVTNKSKNSVGLIAIPGFRGGMHSWKVSLAECSEGFSIGICVGQHGHGISVTYDSKLEYLGAKKVHVKLDCNASKVTISVDGCPVADIVGYDNPFNREVHPYFRLPAPKYGYSKITVLSIDGIVCENNDGSCCIL